MDADEKSRLLPSDELINQRIYEEDDNSSGSSSANEAHYLRKSRHGKRKPFHYAAVHKARTRREAGDSNLATYNRYRYYNRLAHPSIDTLSIPDHVVPANFFFPFAAFIKVPGKQSSLVTIFAIWNTMMGTSLLCIPWAIQQAGFGTGLVIMFLMGAICFYTAYRIVSLKTIAGIPNSEAVEFPDLCKHLLGRWAEWLSAISSVVPLVGCAIVYWVLMSNFVYFIGVYIYESVKSGENNTVIDNSTYPDAYCPSALPISDNSTNLENFFQLVVEKKKDTFYKFWDMDGSIPFYMAVCLAPLISLKSPTFFTKFNAVGTFSVVYLLIFIVVKGSFWGIHFDVQNVRSDAYVKMFQPQFPVLIGILSMSFFIHNCVLSIMRNQRNPEKNTRDLTIAYVLVGLTYLVIGVGFLITFPYAKDCIEDNLLNNFKSDDAFAVCTRAFLLFQVITLYPLIVYLVRVQIMHFIFGSIYPSLIHVLVLNALVLATCILFSIYLPKLGTIMRYCGAFAGLIYIFTLPCIAYMKALKNKDELTMSSMFFHGFLMLLGVCSFFAQFFIVKGA